MAIQTIAMLVITTVSIAMLGSHSHSRRFVMRLGFRNKDPVRRSARLVGFLLQFPGLEEFLLSFLISASKRRWPWSLISDLFEEKPWLGWEARASAMVSDDLKEPDLKKIKG